MSTEDLLQIHDADLARLDALDRAYYATSHPTTKQIAAFECRKAQREVLRTRLYNALLLRQPGLRSSLSDRPTTELVRHPALRRLAHDLRNKLHVIIGYADLLQSQPNLDCETKDELALISNAGHQMDALINSTLTPN